MIRFFAGHPTAANLLMIVFLIAGLFSLPGLIRETFPPFKKGEVEVIVRYPGASADDVERAICRKLEDSVDGISGIDEVVTEANEHYGRMVVKSLEGADFSQLMSDVKTEVEAIDDFPDQTEKPIIRHWNRYDAVISIAIGANLPQTELKAYVEDLKTRIKQQTGVKKILIQGFSDHELRIALKDELLRQYNLSVSDVAQAIHLENIDLPAGTIETGDREILVRFMGEKQTPATIGETIIFSSPAGAIIRLKDIAEISDTFEEEENRIELSGMPSAILNIQKNSDEDSLRIYDKIANFLAEERLRCPKGIKLVITQDYASITRDRLNMIVKNGWQGLLLVFAILWLFFGWNYAFWVVMGLPVSFLGGLFCMLHLGISINMISMVGLLLGIGLLMDDAIVVSENIARLKQEGLETLEAAIQGTKQVLGGVFSSFLTTVCVFGGLTALSGNLGMILKDMPKVLILVLAVSLIEGFLILPHHLIHTLNKPNIPGSFRQGFLRWFDHFRLQKVAPLIEKTVKNRYLFLGVIMAALIVALAMPAGGFLKFSALPELEGDTAICRILLPQGTPLKETEKVVRQVEKGLQQVVDELNPKQPNGQNLVRHVSTIFNHNTDSGEQGGHVATVYADLLPAETRNTHIKDLISRWRIATGKVPDALALNFKEPIVTPTGKPLYLRVMGKNLPILKQASDRLQNWLRKIDGLDDIYDDLRPGKQELHVELLDSAKSLGVNSLMVASQLRAAFQGEIANEIQVGIESIEVTARLEKKSNLTLAILDQFTIRTNDGREVPLTNITRITEKSSWAKISRVDGQRTVSVYGEVDIKKANVEELINTAKNEIIPEIETKFPGVTVVADGQVKNTADTMVTMQRAMILGVIGVFLILSYQFRSWFEPLLVMAIIPFSMIGVVIGHMIMGFDLAMPSIMGFISLAGVVVNDSILLVEFVHLNASKGEKIIDAAIKASLTRVRPILLTSLTTIAGMLPLLFESSLQAQILQPLVISLVFGLTAATLMVLFLVPCLYAILDDFGFFVHRIT